MTYENPDADPAEIAGLAACTLPNFAF